MQMDDQDIVIAIAYYSSAVHVPDPVLHCVSKTTQTWFVMISTHIGLTEIAGLDIDGRLRRGGHCKTGQRRTGH